MVVGTANAIDVIEQDGSHNIIGILDKQSCRSTELMGYSILGTDDRLSSLIEDGLRVMITIGQMKQQNYESEYSYVQSALGLNSR